MTMGVSPVMVINANGTGTMGGDPVDSWKVKGPELKMDYSGVESIVKWSVSGNTLTLDYPSDTSTIGMGNLLITYSPLTKQGGTVGPGGGGNNAKPEKLSNNATHSQAVAKLDAIIAYPGTPAATKQQAQELKSAMTTPGFETTWVTTASTYIILINNMIDTIPGSGLPPVAAGLRLSYDGNGANGEVPAESFYGYGATVTVVVAPGNLTKDGCSFIGWNTEPDGSGIEYYVWGTVTFVITRDITLYAIWAEMSDPIES
jgi:hypothetical protein